MVIQSPSSAALLAWIAAFLDPDHGFFVIPAAGLARLILPGGDGHDGHRPFRAMRRMAGSSLAGFAICFAPASAGAGPEHGRREAGLIPRSW
jgi:hypothetical protein